MLLPASLINIKLACSRAYGPFFGLPENDWIANENNLYIKMPLVVGLLAHSSWPNIA